MIFIDHEWSSSYGASIVYSKFKMCAYFLATEKSYTPKLYLWDLITYQRTNLLINLLLSTNLASYIRVCKATANGARRPPTIKDPATVTGFLIADLFLTTE